MSTATANYTKEEIDAMNAARAAKIASSKILRNGVQSPIPFGIMDVLFYDKESKKTSKYTGKEGGDGNIIFLLPVRTQRDLSRWAAYSIPSSWKVKFSQGDQVYPVVNADGYISKLIPATNMGSSNAFVTAKQVMANAQAEAEKEFNAQPEAVAETAQGTQSTPPADGFEADEEGPF